MGSNVFQGGESGESLEAAKKALSWKQIIRYARPEFPLHIFPEQIQKLLIAKHKSGGVAVDYLGGVVLAVLSASIGLRTEVQLSSDHSQPLNLYVLLVGGSGVRKSSAFALRDPMDDKIWAFNKVIEQENRPLSLQIETLKKQLGRSNCSDPDGTSRKIVALEEQLKPKFLKVVSDTTTEALAREASLTGGNVAVISDEPTFLDVLIGRLYSPKSGVSNMDIVLKGYDRGLVSISRAGEGRSIETRASIALCLAAQEGIKDTFVKNKETADRGLAQRFLFFFPEENSNYDPRTAPQFQSNLMEEWEQTVARLLEIAKREQIIHLDIDDCAYKKYRDFEAQELVRARQNDGNETYRQWILKNHDRAARVAGLLSLLYYPNKRTVDGEMMERGILFCKEYASRMAAFSLGAIGELPKNLQKILEYASEGDSKTDGAIFDHFKGNTRYLKKRNVFDDDMKELEKRRFIQFITCKTGRAGRPAKYVAVNPGWNNPV